MPRAPRRDDDIVTDHVGGRVSAVLQLPEENGIHEVALDLLLHEARDVPRSELVGESVLGEPCDCPVGHLQRDVLLVELERELVDLLADDVLDDRCTELVEEHHLVEPVAELGREELLHRVVDRLARHRAAAKADLRLADLAGAGVGGHDQDDVAEIGLASLVVRERRVVHDLQQDVEDLRVRLFDLVEQQHRVRRLAHDVHELRPVVVSDVAGRRADEP